MEELSSLPTIRENIMVGSVSYTPSNFRELLEWVNLVKDSQLIPAAYRGKPADIIIACQYGAEVGIKAAHALHSIYIIGGKPSLYGDGFLGVVQSSSKYEWHKEEQGDDWASCTVKRKGSEPHTVVYTKQHAIKAGLWGKAGPWKTNDIRMLQMRARGFACRDQFSDVLKGLCLAEEQEDIIFMKAQQKEEVKQIAQEIPVRGKKVREDQLIHIRSLLEELKKDEDYIQTVLDWAKVEKIEDLDEDLADKWLKKLSHKT